jgi:hypothetical protein
MWDAFLNTDDVDATETIVVTFGVDGAAATTSALGTVDSDDETHTFPSASSDIGSNVRTIAIRMHMNRAAGSGNDALSPKLLSTDFSYTRMPPIRYGYVINVNTNVDIPGGPVTHQVLASIRTILALNTKGTLALGGDQSVDSATVVPLSRMRAREVVGDLVDPGGKKRVGIYPLTFVEV